MKEKGASGKSASAATKRSGRNAAVKKKTTRVPSAGKDTGVATQPNPSDAAFEPIAAAFRGQRDISSARMFGSSGLKVDGRVFAMMVKGDLVVKLPAPRIQELIGSRIARPFDPGHGKIMKEWAAVAATHSQRWLELAQEAHRFVSG